MEKVVESRKNKSESRKATEEPGGIGEEVEQHPKGLPNSIEPDCELS
jgi:hypothetical protein